MKTKRSKFVVTVICLFLFAGCGGSDQGSTAVGQTNSKSQITYQLVPATLSREVFDNGSLIGLRIPAGGTGPINHFEPVSGAFDLVAVEPEMPDIVLSYRVTGFRVTAQEPQKSYFGEINAEGDLGIVQLASDGDLVFNVRLPIVGVEYELGATNARPQQYAVENGKLSFQGLLLRTSPEPPTVGAPSLAIWADPEA